MNKLLMSVWVSGFISISAMAGDTIGTVSQIKVNDTGLVSVSLMKTGDEETAVKPLAGTAEGIKAKLALLLTAKSMGSTVTATRETVDGVNVWSKISVK